MAVANIISPDVYGEAPLLEGAACTGLLVQSFILGGELVSPANVTFIGANDIWHRLVLDAGTIHWRLEPGTPVSSAVVEQGWEYPLTNVGSAAGLIGDRILGCIARSIDGGCRVEIGFQSGRQLVLEEQADVVRYGVI